MSEQSGFSSVKPPALKAEVFASQIRDAFGANSIAHLTDSLIWEGISKMRGCYERSEAEMTNNSVKHICNHPHENHSIAATQPRLSGDLFIWYIILLESATFGLLFVVFAFVRRQNLELFNASQQQLDVSAGAINTALLLTASWCVVRAVKAVRASRREAAFSWLGAGMVCGGGFVALKLVEYSDKAAEGIGLSTNLFFDFYFLITGFHLLHVLAGLFALSMAGIGLARQNRTALNAHTIETVAAFWHLVDLLWLVLFPLVYILR